MDERDKIERLAKAMGLEIIHGSLVKESDDPDFFTMHSDWNPWENPADLRQVIEHIERKATREQVTSLFEKISGMYDSKLEAACAAIRIPSMLADAALAVLELEG